MCSYNSLKSKQSGQSQQGYTLIEMAIAIMIIGIVIAPAFYLFSLYEKNQRIEQTEVALMQTNNAISGFLSIYGRYPCPARMDAVQGDADYGYEFTNAAGECQDANGSVELASSNNTNLTTNSDVLIGALPFRQMNLPESLILDGYGNRLVYAVTDILTDDDTFSTGEGGISIVDLNDNTLITPEHSGHFIVLSAGPNENGAFAKSSAPVRPCPAMGLETENCNNDAVFRYGKIQTDFDDKLAYDTFDAIQQWQLSELDEQDIHLRHADNLVSGIQPNQDPGANVRELDVRIQNGVDDAIVLAEPDPNSGPGAVVANDLCDETGDDCFNPELIAGDAGSGASLNCRLNGMNNGFLVGVAENNPICRLEFEFNCPPGEFLTGFDANGQLICNTQPPPGCQPEQLNTSCGDTRTVSSFFHNGNVYGYAYTGQCYRIDGIDVNILDAATSIAEVEAYVAQLNNQPRTLTDCGPGPQTAQVRDTFECLPDGNWNPEPIHSVERFADSVFGGYTPLYNSGNRRAETNGTPFNPADPMSFDANNTNGFHDCWCREDYYTITRDCRNNQDGQRFSVWHARCPNTANRDQNATRIYPANNRFSNQFCSCTQGTEIEAQSCSSFFGVPDGSLNGTVRVTNSISCGGADGDQPVSQVTDADTSQCSCPRPDPDVTLTTQSCPQGQTNSFTFRGVEYTGVSRILERRWVCPGGPAPQPASSAADAGFWTDSEVVHEEACVCDSTLTRRVRLDCPAGQSGDGIIHEVSFDCDANQFEQPNPTNLVSQDCKACIWQAGTPRPDLQNIAASKRVYSACQSCSGVTSCFEPAGNGLFKVWDGCYCSSER